MTLAQLADVVNAKSYYSRGANEVFAALNEAGRFIFQWVVKENRGYFIKWDTSIVAFSVGTEEYTLPTDLLQLIRVRERPTSNDPWRLVDHADLATQGQLQTAFSGLYQFSQGPGSEFTYFGPYLDSAGSQTAAKAQKFRIAPIPPDARLVELVYSAKYVEIIAADSILTIPDEGHGCLQDFAVAELLQANDDSLAESYKASGMSKLTLFLQMVRDRQLQSTPECEPYLSDMD